MLKCGVMSALGKQNVFFYISLPPRPYCEDDWSSEKQGGCQAPLHSAGRPTETLAAILSAGCTLTLGAAAAVAAAQSAEGVLLVSVWAALQKECDKLRY